MSRTWPDRPKSFHCLIHLHPYAFCPICCTVFYKSSKLIHQHCQIFSNMIQYSSLPSRVLEHFGTYLFVHPPRNSSLLLDLWSKQSGTNLVICSSILTNNVFSVTLSRSLLTILPIMCTPKERWRCHQESRFVMTPFVSTMISVLTSYLSSFLLPTHKIANWKNRTNKILIFFVIPFLGRTSLP